jgi:hypothetical protein
MIEKKELKAAITGMSDLLKYKDPNDLSKASFIKEINFTIKDIKIMLNRRKSDQ